MSQDAMWQYLEDYFGLFKVWLYCEPYAAAYEYTINGKSIRLVDYNDEKNNTTITYDPCIIDD